MTHGKKVGEWGVFERVVTLLLAACVILLAAQAALTWFYVSGITQEIQVVSANQAETARALLAEKTQQATPNPEFDAVVDELHSNLSAIRDELHALNEKASIAAGVTPPQTGGSQR
jgi:Tfp pilus assembly protein PilO